MLYQRLFLLVNVMLLCAFSWRAQAELDLTIWPTGESQAPASCDYVPLRSLLDEEKDPYARWGWLSQQQLQNAGFELKCDAGLCEGVYIPIIDIDQAQSEQANIHVFADSSRVNQDSGTEMIGNVDMRSGPRRLFADRAILDRDANHLSLEGEIKVVEPGVLFLGTRAEFDLSQGTGRIEGVEYVVQESGVRGTTKLLERLGHGVTEMHDASYTSCEPGSNSWHMYAGRFHLDEEFGWGEAYDAILTVQEFPVFYLPYIVFPLDDRRKSGFLWPSISNNSQSGLVISTPYYFNLAPHYDLLLTPTLLSDRGAMLEGEFRYLAEYGDWDLRAAILPSDNASDGDDRWVIGARHQGAFDKNWESRIDFARASDRDYLKDLPVNGFNRIYTSHFLQRGRITYTDLDWRFSGELRAYQLLRDGLEQPYKNLPRLNVQRLGSKNFTFNPLFMADLTAFQHASKVEGQRFYSEAGVNYPMQGLGGFVTPTFKLKHLTANVDEIDGSSYTTSVSAPSFSLDAGIFFERDTEWGDFAYRQTLQPRVFYLYTADKAQEELPLFESSAMTFNYAQLFRERRFNGYDRIEGANQISMGVSSSLLRKSDGKSILSASLGQIVYFSDRDRYLRDTLYPNSSGRSDWAALIEGNPLPGWRYDIEALLNTADNRLAAGSVRIQHRRGEALYNLDYSYRTDVLQTVEGVLGLYDLEQLNGSMFKPINERWAIMARWAYDLQHHRTLEVLGGLEYDSCCWKMQTAFRSYEEQLFNGATVQNSGLYFYFELKGLAGSGSGLGTLLGEAIYGYRSFAQERRLSGW